MSKTVLATVLSLVLFVSSTYGAAPSIELPDLSKYCSDARSTCSSKAAVNLFVIGRGSCTGRSTASCAAIAARTRPCLNIVDRAFEKDKCFKVDISAYARCATKAIAGAFTKTSSAIACTGKKAFGCGWAEADAKAFACSYTLSLVKLIAKIGGQRAGCEAFVGGLAQVVAKAATKSSSDVCTKNGKASDFDKDLALAIQSAVTRAFAKCWLRCDGSKATGDVKGGVDVDINDFEFTDGDDAFTDVGKVRPLNVSDDYEIVRGVSAFVWKSSQDYNPSVRRYAISSDNRHIAIQEGWHKICVYNMSDNFTLFATWEDTSFERIATFTFHNNQNNELVLVFEDSTVVLISVSSKTEVEPQEATLSHQDIEDVKLKKKFLIFDTQKDKKQTRFEIANEGLETWVVAYDMNVRYTIALLSIKEEGFQCLQVNIGVDMLHAFSYCSINEKVLMLVKTSRDGSKPLTTTICQGIDSIKKPIEDVPITIEGQCFGFSPCLYEPIASRSIGQNVYTTRGQFLTKDNDQEFDGQEAQANPLMVAFLVGKSNQVLLTLWEPFIDKEVKTLDLTMEEMPLSRFVHIEFCVSSNVKWVALGCWTNGIFSLFSIKTKLFVWRIKLDTTTSLLSSFTSFKFDSSNTKLIINACNNLYVFCPPCLVEAYELEFQNVTYDFLQNSDGEIEPLNMHHRLLIPAHIIKQIIILQHGPESYMDKRVIDVASSTITSSIALLVHKDSSLFVLEGSFETFFTTSFQEYVKSSLSKPKLPRSMREINVPTPSLHPSRFVYNKQFAWIFLHPNIEKDADSIVLFLAQDELLGLFDNPNCAQDLDRVPFSFVSCFAIKQSKDGSSVCCLHNNGVSVIDLNMRRTLYNVLYNVHLVQHLRIYITKKGQGCFDITSNGRNIIIGWDTINGRMLTLTSTMDAEECKIVLEKGNNSVRTWLFREDCKAFIFIESKEDNNIVSSICIYNVEGYHLKRITREQCSLQAAKIMDLITKEGIQKHALNLDKKSGQLWFITLQTALRSAQLTFMPSNSYSLENCIPYLCPSSFDKQDTRKLAQLATDFGPSLFSMEFNGNNNLDCVSKNFDSKVMAEVFNIALKYGAFFAKAFVEGLKNPVWRDSLKSLLEDNSIPFESQALVWKVGFEGLWMNYRGLFENIMQNNKLEQKVCEIEVPSDIFTKEAFIEARIEAINDIPIQWKENSDQAIATSYWESLNKDQLKNIRRQGGNETTLARVTFFSIAEACKIGLNGIIRFLLMQKAPPSIFKTSLIKWLRLVLFQQALHEKKSESDEGDKNAIIHIIERSYGDPWKTMVIMFYAMIGTFDPEIYYDSGSLSSIITVLFILYLATQLIVMVNMLIATMGDTFDRVKSTNEEQLLIGRARFIDACEAQLRQENITTLEDSIGTYLFVLFPNDGEVIDEMQVWQGRVKTIEDRVGDMIKELRKDIMMKFEENIGKMMTVEECTNQLETMNIEIKEMKRDIEQIRNVLFLLKDRS
eukprot:g7506.t1